MVRAADELWTRDFQFAVMVLAGARLLPSLYPCRSDLRDAFPNKLLFAKVLHATNSIHADLHRSLDVGVARLCGAGRRPRSSNECRKDRSPSVRDQGGRSGQVRRRRRGWTLLRDIRRQLKCRSARLLAPSVSESTRTLRRLQLCADVRSPRGPVCAVQARWRSLSATSTRMTQGQMQELRTANGVCRRSRQHPV